MYTLTQILKDLAQDCTPPPEMIRTIWDRILFFLSQKKLEQKSEKQIERDMRNLK